MVEDEIESLALECALDPPQDVCRGEVVEAHRQALSVPARNAESVGHPASGTGVARDLERAFDDRELHAGRRSYGSFGFAACAAAAAAATAAPAAAGRERADVSSEANRATRCSAGIQSLDRVVARRVEQLEPLDRDASRTSTA